MRFSEMVGQGHITRTLSNAIAHDRVHHAYLFCGVRGLGKTTAARILARGLVCENGPTADPCNECSQCLGVIAGHSVDVREIDGASNNSVEDIRALRERVHYLPQSARRKIYIIDEVHMLSASAFNALLKTLEEPPEHVTFIFATTDPHKVLPTIMSRVSRLEFRRVAALELIAHLESILKREGVGVEAAGLRLVARASDGSVRDALTLLDKIIAFADEPGLIREAEVRDILGAADLGLVSDLIEALIETNAEQLLALVELSCSAQQDFTQLAMAVLFHLRDIAVLQASPSIRIDASEAMLEIVRSQAQRWSRARVSQAFDRFSRVVEQIDRSRVPRLTLEMGLLDLLHAPELLDIADVVLRLEQLADPQGDGGGGGARGPTTAGAAPPPAGARTPQAPVSQSRGHESTILDNSRRAGPARVGDEPGEHRPDESGSQATSVQRSTPATGERAPPGPCAPSETPSATRPVVPAQDSRPQSAATQLPSPSASPPAREPASPPEEATALEPPPEGTVARELWQLLSDSGTFDRSRAGAGQSGHDDGSIADTAPEITVRGPARINHPTPTTGPTDQELPTVPATPAPPAADGELDANSIAALPGHFAGWERLLAAVRGGDHLLHAVLCDMGLGLLRADHLELVTPRGSFAAGQLESRPDMRATLERLLVTHLDVPSYRLIDGQPGHQGRFPSMRLVIAYRERSHRESVEHEARNHPAVRAVITAFNGELREVVVLAGAQGA